MNYVYANQAAEGKRLLSAQEVADLLGISVSTLAKWRMLGSGPAFIKLSRRVAYAQLALDDWLEAQTRRSTSDIGGV